MGRDPENRAILERSDFTGTFVAGGTASAVALVSGVLVHTGVVGVGGAVAGCALLLAAGIAILVSFARSGWRAIGRPDRSEAATPAAD